MTPKTNTGAEKHHNGNSMFFHMAAIFVPIAYGKTLLEYARVGFYVYAFVAAMMFFSFGRRVDKTESCDGGRLPHEDHLAISGAAILCYGFSVALPFSLLTVIHPGTPNVLLIALLLGSLGSFIMARAFSGIERRLNDLHRLYGELKRGYISVKTGF